MIKLDKRLLALAELVEGDVVADIGCDHGRLSVFLLQSGKARHIYAVDISEPSLKKTKQLAKICGVDESITTICGDGLTVLPQKADMAIIAGVGGKKTQEILSDPRRSDGTTTFVLQPMRNTEELLLWLAENGYEVIFKSRVEMGKFYDIIKAVR